MNHHQLIEIADHFLTNHTDRIGMISLASAMDIDGSQEMRVNLMVDSNHDTEDALEGLLSTPEEMNS